MIDTRTVERILMQHSVDDSYCIRIAFEDVEKVAQALRDAANGVHHATTVDVVTKMEPKEVDRIAAEINEDILERLNNPTTRVVRDGTVKPASNNLERFITRLKRIGIDVTFVGNYPWVYLDTVNGTRVRGTFQAEHGFTAFWLTLPSAPDKYQITDIRTVFAKIRETLNNKKIHET